MVTTLLTALLAASILGTTPAETALAELGPERAAGLVECGVDELRLTEILALDQQAFDQNHAGGGRWLQNFEDCEAAAADLIAVWREHSGNLTEPTIIDWHEGQMRAQAGQTQKAIELFDRSRSDSPAWNLYVDASIAFLQQDKPRLQQARDELAQLKPSKEEMDARRQFLADNPQITMPEGFVEQPQNLSVVDRLLTCFGQPYSDAYSGRCKANPITSEAIAN